MTSPLFPSMDQKSHTILRSSPMFLNLSALSLRLLARIAANEGLLSEAITLESQAQQYHGNALFWKDGLILLADCYLGLGRHSAALRVLRSGLSAVGAVEREMREREEKERQGERERGGGEQDGEMAIEAGEEGEEESRPTQEIAEALCELELKLATCLAER